MKDYDCNMVLNKLSYCLLLSGHVGTARIGPTSSFTWYFYCTSEKICQCLNEKSNNIIANWEVNSIVNKIERARHTKASSNIEI